MASVKARRSDSLFLEQFRMHVGNSLVCACTFDGSDRDCNVGHALWAVAHQLPWDERKVQLERALGR